jgi:hypothetical protein
VLALKALSAMPEVAEKLTDPQTRVQLLWDVCRIPDFPQRQRSRPPPIC